MATTYDKIAVLNDVCRKLEEAHLGELLGPLRAKMAELALQPSPVALLELNQERMAEAPQSDEDTGSERGQKRSKHDLVHLFSEGHLRNEEPCYISTRGFRENYLMRFSHGDVSWFCPRTEEVLNSPNAVGQHHARQIHDGHLQPSKGGNGWKFIKLSDRGNQQLGSYRDIFMA